MDRDHAKDISKENAGLKLYQSASFCAMAMQLISLPTLPGF
ncbi:hypothetical protein LT85_4224 [Collimonas arenae]|uniref:Uncharacterized protein n=1 Tax=Collimonas arenae TaxID=279058 RepID=A0A0A1FKG7_9BURK|nr:hypothetical protein LT85_4224 [Collimonas arenae]